MKAEQGNAAPARLFAGLLAMLAAFAAVCALGGLGWLAVGHGQLGLWQIPPGQMGWSRPASRTLLPRHLFDDEASKPLHRLPFHDPQAVQVFHLFTASPQAGADLAIMATGIDGTARAFANFTPVRPIGDPLSAGPAMADKTLILWEVPANHLHPGPNRIDLVVTDSTGRALSGPVFFGPGKALAAAAQRWDRAERAMQWVLLTTAALAVIVNLLAAGFRASVLHLAVAAGCGVVAVRAMFGLLGSAWQIGPVAIDPLLTGALALSGAIALRRVGDPDGRGLGERAALLVTLLGATAALLGAATGRAELAFWSGRTAGLAGLAGLLWAIGATIRHSLAAPRLTRRTRMLLGVLCGLLLVAGVILAAGLAAIPLFVTPFAPAAALAFALVVLCGLSGWAGFVSLIAGLRTRLDHARTIREQRAALEATTQALEEQTRQALLLEERQRMARDVHDGIGGQLATLIAQVRLRRIGMEQVEQALVGGLSELRFLVGSLDVMGASLADALATFLDQARQQLAAAGMTLDWHQDFERAAEVRDARWILNIYRLMQEAVTNAIRHSGGTRIAISVTAPDGQFTLRIADDGTGMDPAAVHRGRGLNNMERRAVDLGGTFAVDPGDAGQGTAISVRVPLPG